MTQNEKRLRTAQVCTRIGRSRSRLYEMIGSGDFPKPQRVNKRHVYWDEDVVEEWLKEHRQEREHRQALSPAKPVAEKAVPGSRLRVFQRFL